MNFRRLSSRATVAAASTALAAGTLVGLGSTAAHAATVSNTYTCGVADLYSGDFALTVSGELPVPGYWAGATVAPDLLSITADATVPDDAAMLLGSAGITGARSDDFGFAMGSAGVSVPIQGDFNSGAEGTTWNATGKNAAFTTPAPGAYDVLLPETFTITTETASGDGLELNCTLAEGQTSAALIEDFGLQKQTDTAVTAKAGKVKKGAVAKVKVTVTSNAGAVPAGKVVAKKGKKTLAKANVKSGKAVLKIKKGLKLGPNKLVVTYVNNPSVAGAKTNAVVKVTR